MRFEVYNPFIRLEEILSDIDVSQIHGVVVDFHREVTSELAAIARFFDGKISMVYGTHTHIQTNDEDILS